MKHKGDLDARLENWAKAQRYGNPSGSVIGSAEGRYPGDNPGPRSIESMLLDPSDADVVEQAWGRLMPFDKEVLRMHYILCMSPPVICRKLKLPRRSQGAFMMALAHAKQEIAKMLEKLAETRRAQRDLQRSYDLATGNYGADYGPRPTVQDSKHAGGFEEVAALRGEGQPGSDRPTPCDLAV